MNTHVVESTCEFSAFIKGDAMSGSEKDAGFCSGGDEDDMSGLHSPSASEDSIEVQIMPISLRNKRKLAEPRKIQEQLLQRAPLKKRRFDDVIMNNTNNSTTTTTTTTNITTITTTTTINNNNNNNNNNKNNNIINNIKKINDNNGNMVVDDETIRSSSSPFRPWSSSSSVRTSDEIKNQENVKKNLKVSSGDIEDCVNEDLKEQRWLQVEARRRKEEAQRQNEQRIHEEVLARLEQSEAKRNSVKSPALSTHSIGHQMRHEKTLTLSTVQLMPPMPLTPRPLSSLITTPGVTPTNNLTHPRMQQEPLALIRRDEVPRIPAHPAIDGSLERPIIFSTAEEHQQHCRSENNHGISSNHERNAQQQQHRNYKNMTRERRIEANARERTRVHTISAAFETLRRSIPAYSHNQKLSKLSVLRIACSYIMTLSKIVSTPEGNETTGPALGACVDLVSRTIQTEGKLRKKKDE